MPIHIVFVVRRGYIQFRTSDNRTGSNPIQESVAWTMHQIKQSLGLDESTTEEVLWSHDAQSHPSRTGFPP